MANSVIFFTAGAQATPEETTELNKVLAGTEPALSLRVANLTERDYTGYDENGLELPDYVYALDSGDIPEAYAGVNVLDPDNLPVSLPDTAAVVSNGDEIAGSGGTFTVTVADGVITGGTWAAD